MTSRLRKIWTKLGRMSALEIRTRVGQEITSALTGNVSRGSGHGLDSVGPSSRQRDFFFSKAEIQSRTKVLRQHLPEVADAIVREAGEVCQHRFRLLGYEPLDYGQTIDWHLDAVHGRERRLFPGTRFDSSIFLRLAITKLLGS